MLVCEKEHERKVGLVLGTKSCKDSDAIGRVVGQIARRLGLHNDLEATTMRIPYPKHVNFWSKDSHDLAYLKRSGANE